MISQIMCLLLMAKTVSKVIFPIDMQKSNRLDISIGASEALSF